MVQTNSKRPTLCPQKRPVESKIQKHECKCDEKACKCEKACECKKECNCGCGSCCSCGCGSNIINGLLVLVGTLMVAGSVLVLAHTIEKVAHPQQNGRPVAAQKNGRVSDTRAFEDFIKKNPKIIIDSVSAYYQKQQAAEKPAKPADQKADAAMVSQILGDKTNHVLGNPKGSFVVIEFFDYNCGYCRMMNTKMAEAIKKSDNIRWVLMDAPIFGERSEIISRYAYAAAQQGKYAEFHAALGDASDKSEEGLKAIGKKLGLDVKKLSKDASSEAAKKKIEANREYTKKLQMGGVPMFIIDGQIQGGAFPDEQMAGYIKKANAMKKAKK